MGGHYWLANWFQQSFGSPASTNIRSMLSSVLAEEGVNSICGCQLPTPLTPPWKPDMRLYETSHASRQKELLNIVSCSLLGKRICKWNLSPSCSSTPVWLILMLLTQPLPPSSKLTPSQTRNLHSPLQCRGAAKELISTLDEAPLGVDYIYIVVSSQEEGRSTAQQLSTFRCR